VFEAFFDLLNSGYIYFLNNIIIFLNTILENVIARKLSRARAEFAATVSELSSTIVESTFRCPFHYTIIKIYV
jgi:hypothetical protein